VEAHTPIPKLVLKGHTPAGSPTRDQGSLKLKIKLGGTPAVESSERGKKRERSDSSANLVNIPAAKMARALGTGNAEAEAAFLQHKLGKKEKKSSK